MARKNETVLTPDNLGEVISENGNQTNNGGEITGREKEKVNADNQKTWFKERGGWQGEIVKKSIEQTKKAKKRRKKDASLAETEIPKPETSGDEHKTKKEAADSGDAVVDNANMTGAEKHNEPDEELQKWTKHLKTLEERFNESIKRDPNFNNGLDRDGNLDDSNETKTRAKLGILITEARERIKEIKNKTQNTESKGKIEKDDKKSTKTTNSYNNWWKERSKDRKDLLDRKNAEKEALNNAAKEVDNPADLHASDDDEQFQQFNGRTASETKEDDGLKNIPNAEAFQGNHEEGKTKARFKKAYSADLEKSVDSGIDYSEVNKKEEAEIEIKDNIQKLKDRQIIDKENEVSKNIKAALRQREKDLKEIPEISEELKNADLAKRAEGIKDRAYKEIPGLDEVTSEDKDLLETRLLLLKEMENQNAELRENLKNAERVREQMDQMQAKLNEEMDQIDNPKLKDRINKFFKDPKVKGAIIAGLIGGGAYIASGGTMVPAYFAVKAALAKAGISIFVPAAAGHGLSTWGTAAVGGGFAGYLSEKLGIIKGEKSGKEKRKESLDNTKNAKIKPVNEVVNNESQTVSTSENQVNKSWMNEKGEVDLAVLTELVKVKDPGFIHEIEENPDLLTTAIDSFKGKTSIIGITGKQRELNRTEKWLKAKRDEVSQKSATEAIHGGEEKKQEEANKNTAIDNVSNKIKGTVKGLSEHEFDALTKTDEEDKRLHGDSQNLLTLQWVEEKKEKPNDFLDMQTKVFEARKSVFRIAEMIAKNERDLDTKVILALHELLSAQIDNRKSDAVQPAVEFMEYLINRSKKEKISFLDKGNKSGTLSVGEKESLVREIKKYVLRMAQEDKLGSNQEEREKNMRLIESLLDSKEFKEKI